MRFKRPVRAAALAVLAYILIILAGPLLGRVSVVAAPTAHAAATIEEACGTDSTAKTSACKAGFNGSEAGLSQTTACQSFKNDIKAGCVAGYQGAGGQQNVQYNQTAGTADPNAPPVSGVDEEKCAEAQGASSLLVCPLFDKVSRIFADGGKDLISNFLAVEPLGFTGDLYNTWDAIRTLANIAFIFIFLFIIFANTASMDIKNYSIRRMLPRLIAAAVLVQASFLISALIIDFGNLMGVGIGSLIHSALHGGSTTGFSISLLVNDITAIGAALVVLALVNWALAAPLMLVIIIAVIGFIATLAIRYLLIGILVVVSPLAFAAMVLPNTEQYFNKWRTMLVRLVLMYPIIIAILSVASNVGSLIPVSVNSGSTAGSIGQSLTSSVIKIMIFAACFYAVTQTFKWAGGLMSEAYNRYSKFVGGQNKKAKDSARYKETQKNFDAKRNARVRQVEDKLGGMMGSKNAAVRAGGRGLFAAGSLAYAGRSTHPADRQRAESQVVTDTTKALGELKDADMMNQRMALQAYYGDPQQRQKARQHLQDQGAESLLDYTNTLEQRQAFVRRLAENNLVGEEVATAIMNSGSEADYQMLLRENGKNMPKASGLYARHRSDSTDLTKTNALGNPIKMGDANADAIGGMNRAMSNKSLKQDYLADNFKLAAKSTLAGDSAREVDIAQQLARINGETLDPAVMEEAFNANNKQDFMTADKRVAALLMLGRHKDQFDETDNGKDVWARTVRMFQSQAGTVQQNVRRKLEEEDDWVDIKTTLGL